MIKWRTTDELPKEGEYFLTVYKNRSQKEEFRLRERNIKFIKKENDYTWIVRIDDNEDGQVGTICPAYVLSWCYRNELEKYILESYQSQFENENSKFSPSVMKLARDNLKKFQEEADEAFLIRADMDRKWSNL